MTYSCTKGCRSPTAANGIMIHYSKNECPAETYDPAIHPGRPRFQKAKGHPGSGAPAPATPKVNVKVPESQGITLTGGQANVTKGSTTPKVVVVDYVVDAEHTKALWNFGFRIMYWVHVKIDEWVFDWHQHIPKVQFQLTANAEMSISLTPRNLYSRAATWFTKNLCGAKNLEQAHAAIDSILFFEAFGGIFVAVIFHYEHVYKNSPKMKAKRAAKAALLAAKKGAQVGMTQAGTTTQVLPLFTTRTAEAAVA